jgi:hypothetical protein
MDPKMDQCFNFAQLHEMTVSQLFDPLVFSNASFKDVLGLFIFLEKNEINFLNGSSIMESTHRCSFMWKTTLDRSRNFSGRIMSLLFLYSKCVLKTMSMIMASMLSADIYEGSVPLCI